MPPLLPALPAAIVMPRSAAESCVIWGRVSRNHQGHMVRQHAPVHMHVDYNILAQVKESCSAPRVLLELVITTAEQILSASLGYQPYSSRA